jgi:hypothetical protein
MHLDIPFSVDLPKAQLSGMLDSQCIEKILRRKNCTLEEALPACGPGTQQKTLSIGCRTGLHSSSRRSFLEIAHKARLGAVDEQLELAGQTVEIDGARHDYSFRGIQERINAIHIVTLNTYPLLIAPTATQTPRNI